MSKLITIWTGECGVPYARRTQSVGNPAWIPSSPCKYTPKHRPSHLIPCSGNSAHFTVSCYVPPSAFFEKRLDTVDSIRLHLVGNVPDGS